ncbi:MAG: ParA family protein [Bacteroidales bacterium]
MSGKIIAISNHKGGVGKTTSCINIGAGLAQKNKKVLLIDMDPQTNLSQSLGISNPENNIYVSMKENTPLVPYKINNNLFVVPAINELGGAELELSAEAGREFILKELLDPLQEQYDYVLIDCPPSLGLLTINAFTASHEIYIPMQAQYLALQGIGNLLGLVEKIQKRLQPNLEITGIFITQFDKRRVLSRYVMDTLESHFGNRVFKTRIRNNISLAEAPNTGQDIFRYQKNSNGAFDYGMLVKEMLSREISPKEAS